MLNATLLLLLLLPTPQEPGRDWSPMARDVFLQAVHLLDVGTAPEAAGEAWDALALLAGREEFAGRPGELAVIKVVQRRAALRLGRLAEARRLADEARELAAGTPREAEVLAMLAREPGPMQELDPEFLELVRSTLEAGRPKELKGYGKRLLPYLEHFLEPDEGGRPCLQRLIRDAETPSGAIRQATPFADQLVEAFFVVATPEAMERLLRRIREEDWPAPDLAAFLFHDSHTSGKAVVERVQPVDDGARAAWVTFLVGLSRDEGLARARVGILLACRYWRYNWFNGAEALQARFREILQDPDSPLAAVLVESLPWERVSPDLPVQEWEEAAVNSPQVRVAETARWRLYAARRAPVLLDLARAGGHEDRLRFAYVLGRWEGRFNAPAWKLLAEFRRKASTWSPRKAIEDLDLDRLPGAEELLVAMLGSADPLERRTAALAAASRGWESVLERALAGGDQEVRSIALLGLQDREELPPGVLARLVDLLDDPDLAAKAASVLLQDGDNLEEPVLVRCARLVEDYYSLYEAVKQWARLPDGEGRLVALAGDRQAPAVAREIALRVLAESAPKSPACAEAAFALAASPGASDRADLLLAHHADAWMPGALATDLDPATGPSSRLAVAVRRAFARAASQAESGRDPALQHWPWILAGFVRRDSPTSVAFVASLPEDVAAAEWLVNKQFGEGQAFGDLLARLALRFPASEAIQGQLCSRGRGFPLGGETILRLLDSPAEAVLDLALDRLSLRPDLVPQVEDRLLELLHDPRHAAAAAQVLVRAEGDRVPALLAVAGLVGIRDRASYLKALGATGDPRVVPVLLEALQSTDPGVYQAANDALARLRSIQEQRAFWESWQAFGLGRDPVAALLAKVRSDKRDVRVEAVRALGTLGAKEALPVLVDLLEDEDPAMRAAAREALERIHAATAPPKEGGKD